VEVVGLLKRKEEGKGTSDRVARFLSIQLRLALLSLCLNLSEPMKSRVSRLRDVSL
jgi:hypothetical protein